MTHLNEDQIIQYIHHTLTDAERETMDRHLADCPSCRALLDVHEELQRRIRYGLQACLRPARPSSRLEFRRIAGRVKHSRRWWLFVRGSNVLLNGVATLLLVLLFGLSLLALVRIFSAPAGLFPGDVQPVTLPSIPLATATAIPWPGLGGTWERQKPGYPKPGRYVWQINADGTDRVLQEDTVGVGVVESDGYCCFSSDGRWQLTGTELQLQAITLLRDTSDLWQCNGTGRYRVEWLTNGGVKLALIADTCDEREQVIAGGVWRRVPPPARSAR